MFAKRGLVIAPLLRQNYIVLSEDDRKTWCEQYPDIKWHFADTLPFKPDGSADWVALCQMYLEMIQMLEIDLIIAGTNDDTAVVHAFLAENCPSIQGPSLESIVLANHKVLCRDHLIPAEQNLRYYSIDLDEECSYDNVARTVGSCMLLKPACGSGSTHVYVIENQAQFEEALSKYRRQARDSYFDKFGSVLSGVEDKYPELKKRLVIAEEYVDINQGECSITAQEIAAYNGQIIPWIIVDNIYWEKQPQCFLGCGTPSVHSQEVQEKLWNAAKDTMKLMIQYGYTHCLVNIETFAWLDGKVKVMEINSRPFYQGQPLYTSVYHKGDHIQAMIDMQLGKQVVTPIPKDRLNIPSAPKYALNNYISTNKGGLAKEIYDFEKAAEYQRKNKRLRWFTLLVDPDRQLNDSPSGNVFAWTYSEGESFADCQNQMKEVSKDLLSEQHYKSLWDEEFDWQETFARYHQRYTQRMNGSSD